ncbi:MAG: DUF4832 domain-containing protein [Clostridia bacterium]|nr:DUF4832 domain-containing protein [Clostridia bacterium]
MTKKILIAAVCVLVASVIAIITLCCFLPKSALPYEESTEAINNPDQGFYRPIYVRVKEDGATYNKNIVNASTQLYHLRIDISDFSAAVNGSADKPLTDKSLEDLNSLLSYLKEKEKNAVVRFAYDPSYGGAKDKEPAKEIILKHIQQVCPILNKYQATVTAIEAGLIGPWGEMHSSKIANAEYISPIIETFLTNTANLPVLVRTPKMIYNYLGIKLADIDGYEISATDKAYRLGLYNDGYLGSDSDLGTYTDREREIEFLSKQTNHLPYGGEVVIPNSPLHDIETCLPEMFKINLSYLNIEWNNQVIDKWKSTVYTAKCGDEKIYYGKTAFEYIQNRMGYRFVVTNSKLQYKDKFTANLTLKNLGFGNLNKTKYAKLLFVDGSGEVKLTKQVEDFTGAESVSYSADLNLAGGKYEVYLCLYGEEVDGKPTYALQFANKDIWNATLKANKLGEIEIK